ncbi:hypothetical protein RUM44_006712 [Polyplax serrata]|uniref:Patched domain-containing protein 3 n=1 Tax=Polyplax serrata TaxID=468196 RepID=A0ABR1AIV2_POLSC
MISNSTETITKFQNLKATYLFAVNRHWLYRAFCAGGINHEDPNNPIDNKEHMIMVFFKDHVATFLNKWQVKVMVLLAFAAYLVGACYGITTLKEGLQRRKLSRADSYSVEFYDREDYYFREFPYRIQVIVSGELNYSDPNTQNEIERLTQTFENSSFVSNSLYTESWVRSFTSYVRRNGEDLNVTIDTEEDFISNLKSLWLFKPNPFSLDVKFNEDESRILASRFMIQAVNITDGNHEKEMVQELRRIARESPLNVTVFHPYFVFFDQFELVRPTSIQCMVLGAIIMMIISFIFIPDMICGVWVAFSIISIELGVAGYMALWDVRLDSISMINLIMCIGFSVDFTAHICYTYMSSSEKTAKERVRDSLYSLGLPIVQGSFSTILSVFALILADSYIFLVFFKMVFLVVFFGAMHGLFLLPVLLSLFGPGGCTRSKKEKMSKVEQALPYPYCIPHPSLISSNWEQQPKKAEWEAAEKQNNNFLANRTLLPYLPNVPSHMMISTYERNSPMLEKDLGLGTSGEDSSETASGSGQFEIMSKQMPKRSRAHEDGYRKNDKNWSQWRNVGRDGYSNNAYLSDEPSKDRSARCVDSNGKYKNSKNDNGKKKSSYDFSDKFDNGKHYKDEKRKTDWSREFDKPHRDFTKNEVKKFSYPPMSDAAWYRPNHGRYPHKYSIDDSQIDECRRGRQVFRRFSQHETCVRPRNGFHEGYDF